MEEHEILKVEADLTKTAAQALLKRNEELITENRRLKKELAEVKATSDNYWQHILWLRTPEDMKPKAKPCAFCKSEHVGLEGSVCSRAFFVWCLDCSAMEPVLTSSALPL